MSKLKLFTATGLAATALGAGALVSAPSASAKPMTCAVALKMADTYIAFSRIAYAIGDYQGSVYWSGRAEGVLEAAC